MINQTTNYDMFHFREDNRAKIDMGHVNKIKKSIEAKNLLHLRPILVNERNEVIDGQHRLLAAKQLNVPIFYEVSNSFQVQDIAKLNIAKSWTNADYFNFYIKNGNIHYQKLYDFIKKSTLNINTGLHLIIGNSKEARANFKDGKYEYNVEIYAEHIEEFHNTVQYIRSIQGSRPFHKSARFAQALLALFSHPEFNALVWRKNLARFVHKIAVKASFADYMQMILEVYNWRTSNKIEIYENMPNLEE